MVAATIPTPRTLFQIPLSFQAAHTVLQFLLCFSLQRCMRVVAYCAQHPASALLFFSGPFDSWPPRGSDFTLIYQTEPEAQGLPPSFCLHLLSLPDGTAVADLPLLRVLKPSAPSDSALLSALSLPRTLVPSMKLLQNAFCSHASLRRFPQLHCRDATCATPLPAGPALCLRSNCVGQTPRSRQPYFKPLWILDPARAPPPRVPPSLLVLSIVQQPAVAAAFLPCRGTTFKNLS
jgi:hypothetical protein